MIDLENLKEHVFDVVGAIYEVHTELGPGLNEYCYQEGLRLQLEEQEIQFKKELSIHPTYHGKEMEAVYRVDFLCKGDIVVECKSVDELNGDMRAQLYNYMRLLKCPCGIIVNFAGKKADVERYFYDDQTRNILTIDGRCVHKYRQ
jgi:GxxExxY protein